MKNWILLLIVSCSIQAAENWSQFRGPGALGVAENKGLPGKWSATENVLWKQQVPGRGWSSPVVWGKQVFLTAVETEGKQWEARKGLYYGGERKTPPTGKHHWKVICLNLETGKLIWEKTAHSGIPKGSIHIKNSYASETPITDGERVYAYFGNQGLYCYTLEGELLWKKEWPAYKTRYGWGLAASPVLHKGRLYIVNDNEEQSFLVALDAKSGKQIWRTERKGEKSNWSTPYVWENKLRTEIITPGTRKNRAYDLNGKLLYEFGGNSSITIATPYAKFGLLYVTSGYVGDPKKPMFAIRPGAKGDISLESDQDTNKYVAWCQRRAGPYNPSTIVYGDLMYVLLDRGLVGCYEAKTGKLVYGPERIVPRGGAFTSSPWAYNGKVFFLDENGVTYVLKAGRKFEMLGTNRLDPKKDMCMATPAIAGSKLLIRTDSQVYCLSGASPKTEEVKKLVEPQQKYTPGRTQSRSYFFKEADKKMDYSIYIPSGYDKSKSYPLMVALHGLGGSDRGMIRYRGLTQLAQRHGYIVVAPMGYNSSGWYGSRGQTSRRGNPRNLGELSEKDVMNVLAITRGELNINSRRIYLMGHSMGGGGTWHIGMKYPDIWAGLSPIAPAAPRNINDLAKAKHIPVILVQGDQDRLVPVSGARRWAARMKDLKMDYTYLEIAGGGHGAVAWENLPKIFEFFNKRQKVGKAGKVVEEGEDTKANAPSKPSPEVTPAKTAKVAAPTPGIVQLRKYFFEQAKQEMPYSLYLPKGYDKAKKYPLMVALHGLGSSHWQIIRYPGLTKLAEEHGYIVVAPMGYNSSGWYGSRGQSSRRSKPENLGELSEKDVMNVLQIVRDEFSVDDKRIYLMGHSMGGGGTWHLGMKYPKLWAGLAPLAPAPPRNISDLTKIKDTPVIVVCGDEDGLVRSARVWVSRMKELKMNYEYIEVKGGGHIRPAYQKLAEVYAFFEKQFESTGAHK